MKEQFRKFAHHSAQAVGSPWAFFLALVSIVIWGMLGPHFHYSDTWQLVINTATSLSTFLVVFLIQNTQNRDAKVVQLKLDELIRAIQPARTALVQMEDLSDADLDNCTGNSKNYTTTPPRVWARSKRPERSVITVRASSGRANARTHSASLAVDVFKPHWIHRACGGVIAGTRNAYLCDKCGENAPAIGAEIPVDVDNRREYFACHPELEVSLLNAEQMSQASEVLYDSC